MANLSDLGFSKGIIAETIVSTYNFDGKPNAAPMGVYMEDEQNLTINLFTSSITYKNIKTNGCAVVNLTNDIEAFYKTTFKDTNLYGTLPSGWFQKSKSVNAPKLIFADATIDVLINNFESVSVEKIKAKLKVKHLEAKLQYPQVHNRAMSQTLEAIIHATRVKTLLNDDKEQNNVNKLLETIANCYDIVNRVAPNSSYSLIMDYLMKRIRSWQEQK